MPQTLLDVKDALSSVLKPVSVVGNAYCRSELSAPWAVSFAKKDDALFHVIERSKCFLMHPNEEEATPLNQEDLVIFSEWDGPCDG